jgi:hypothetical protein
MLSYDEIRTALKKPDMPDAEAEEIRRTLYAFAHVMIDGFLWEKGLRPKDRCTFLLTSP